MGTMLHAAGAALDRSLPELNLSDPGLVATIHDSYLSAGADIIQANTFGANRLWLADHGFPDKVAEINRAGVRLAGPPRTARAGRSWWPASVSPAVTAPQRRRVGAAERMEVLREQILALVADDAADLLILETFGYLDELVEAVSVAAVRHQPAADRAGHVRRRRAHPRRRDAARGRRGAVRAAGRDDRHQLHGRPAADARRRRGPGPVLGGAGQRPAERRASRAAPGRARSSSPSTAATSPGT